MQTFSLKRKGLAQLVQLKMSLNSDDWREISRACCHFRIETY